MLLGDFDPMKDEPQVFGIDREARSDRGCLRLDRWHEAVLMVDSIIAHTKAIDHGFRERTPRQVNGFTDFMTGTSFRFRATVD